MTYTGKGDNAALVSVFYCILRRGNNTLALTGVFAAKVELVANGGDPLAAVAIIITDTHPIRPVQVDLETVNARANTVVVEKLHGK